jgi:predicted acetyltransferase
MAASAVTLDPASAADATLLANLLELYIHDLSEFFPDVAIGPDGRFGYARLRQYWSDPAHRFAFLIRCDGSVAGFALAKHGSPAVDDPSVLDVAEFFVMRQYRGADVGRRAAFLLWTRFPGTWTVRVLETNRGALAFWRRIIDEFAPGSVRQFALAVPHPQRVFQFTSSG